MVAKIMAYLLKRYFCSRFLLFHVQFNLVSCNLLTALQIEFILNPMSAPKIPELITAFLKQMNS